jgi:hypothetical protein
MKNIFLFLLAVLPFVSVAQTSAPIPSQKDTLGIIFKNPRLTLEGVINCIGFEKESLIYCKIKNLCEMWFLLEKQLGKSDEDAALGTLDMLTKLMIDLGKEH